MKRDAQRPLYSSSSPSRPLLVVPRTRRRMHTLGSAGWLLTQSAGLVCAGFRQHSTASTTQVGKVPPCRGTLGNLEKKILGTDRNLLILGNSCNDEVARLGNLDFCWRLGRSLQGGWWIGWGWCARCAFFGGWRTVHNLVRCQVADACARCTFFGGWRTVYKPVGG